MAENLSHRQRCSLPRRKYGRVRGMLQDVKCIEVQPHGMRRVGKPSVSECISRKQVTEFVVTNRRRQRQHGEQRQAQGDDGKRRTNQHCQPLGRNSCAQSFDSAEPSISQPWRKPRQDKQHWQSQPNPLGQNPP